MQAMSTISEELFAALCITRSIQCERLPEGDAVTADYRLLLGDVEVYVEVKQLNPNDRDRRRAAESAHSGRTPLLMAPTRRVRDQITKAYRQLKAYAKCGHSCIIVLYNNSGTLNYIDSFTVTSAMFGVYGVRVTLNDSRIVRHVGHGFLGGRKVTRNECRGISAVCVVERTGMAEELKLTAYHNPFATQPIATQVLALLASEQFRHDEPHEGQFVPPFPIEIGGVYGTG